jgi:L-2-hydroxyglutarate oxidase LhgO
MYDVIIIGAGISGTTIARELSKYDLKVLVLEQQWQTVRLFIQDMIQYLVH